MAKIGVSVYVDIVVPTPGPVMRTISAWTVGNPLGRGGHGRVFLGTRTNHEAAALKIMGFDEEKDKLPLECEIMVNRLLTDMAEKEDDGGRILRQNRSDS